MGSAALLLGCAAPSPNTKSVPSLKKAEAVPEKKFNLGAGSATAYQKGRGGPKSWVIHWKSAVVSASQQFDPTRGDLREVTGEVYRDGAIVSRFAADQGRADETTGLLQLVGNVVVRDLQQDGRLTCNRLDYLDAAGRYVARDNVQFESRVGTIGTFNELDATADLKRVATPDLFLNSK